MIRRAVFTGARRRLTRALASHCFVLAAALGGGAARAAFAQTGGGADLRWSTVDGGSGRAASGNVVLYGTAGQPDSGVTSAAAVRLHAGFWVATDGASQTPGQTGSPTASRGLGTPTATGSPPAGGPTRTATPTPDATVLGSVTPSPTATPIPILAGDANCDGHRSAADLPALIAAVAAGDPRCGADANGDQIVDGADLDILLALLFG